MKTKILVTASTFPRWEGDSEPRFILDICKELNKYYDVTVLVPSAHGAKYHDVIEGVKVERYRYFPIRKWETLCYPGAIKARIDEKPVRALLVPCLMISLFFQMIKRIKNYELIHANWVIPQGVVQCLFKTPYTISGLGGDVTILNKGIMLKLKKRCIKHAAGIVAVSNATKQEILDIYYRDNVAVITMGCELREYGSQNRIDGLFGNHKTHVLFVGRLVEKKGCEYLIKAMVGIDAELIIVGDGPLRGELEALAKECNIEVQFLGGVEKERLKMMYASADIFVVPSVSAQDGDKEGMPTTIIEGMASEVPIIASDTGGVKDLIEDDYNGLIVQEKDIRQLHQKINYLLDNKEVRNRLVEKGRLTAGEYDYEVIGKKYADVIQKALGE